MLLCVDIGNSNIVFACYREKQLIFTSRVATDATRTRDQYAVELDTILELYGVDAAAFSGAIIGSVVPALTEPLRQACEMVLGHRAMVLAAGVKTGLNIRLDNPAECGADLVAAAVGAKENYPLPLIIVDLGTASKITAVDEKGDFLGGAIMPGLRTSMDALVRSASLLSDFELGAPAKAIGRNTPDCLRSGAVLGFASMLDGMCSRFKAEIGGDVTVVATGGLAHLVVPCCDTEMVLRDDLVTEGLRIVYEKNN
ncbi:MAG: type III pantothenate kinase [Oscillospiraceae bacterium]|nr:type III pantothenate kinase [Oscillospiraceae bacterium]